MAIFSMVDGNTSVFRYGLALGYEDSKHEDPTLLGFTVEIDEAESPLFRDLPAFLEAYKSRSEEFAPRITIQKEFAEQIVKLMKTQDSVVDVDRDRSRFVKGHYINSIAGTNLLTKKIFDYGKDKLTFNLHEDLSMFSTRLAMAYNSLVWSYNGGRVMVPENLTKFVMRVKISEIRNMRSAFEAPDVIQALIDNTTCVVYTLWDCHFDFSNSAPFGDNITINGVGTPLPAPATMSFDVYFKSVSRRTMNPLIKATGNVTIDDLNDNLGITTRTVGSQGTGGDNTDGVTGFSQGTNFYGDPLSNNGDPYQSPQTDAADTNYDPTGLMPTTPTGGDQSIVEARKLFADGKPADDGAGNVPILVDDDAPFDESMKYRDIVDNSEQQEEDWFNDMFNQDQTVGGNIYGTRDINERLRRRAKTSLFDAKSRTLARLRAARSQLVRDFVYDLRQDAGIADDRIIPNNVYYDKRTIAELATKKILADAGFEITNAFIDLTGF